MPKDPLLELLDTDRRSLLRAAARLLGPADAEDAVQDAYLRALEDAGLALDSTQAWLLTVVRHVAIDHWRRRRWMAQWMAEAQLNQRHERDAPSAEDDAALAQEVIQVLQGLAARLTPIDGAALLLHAVFGVEHAEIAWVAGRSVAANRQQLRRALQRLRQKDVPDAETHGGDEHVLRAYLQSLRLRDPDILWAMLREPPIRASVRLPPKVAAPCTASTRPTTVCGIMQLGGQLGLVLSLDGVRLCVVPLGVRTDRELEMMTS
ncbi:sigma-70 family RNA polymerase sigma factor [Hydrogenophaga sp.]|uniref:RNA polymerase sigma factor n=1 Tax=Hydrogenophaga sp. TaxID=1904254 RepID=UPI001ACE5A4A|nr:sigma-70 family RNA polymerase sigma factor [Hydrogenophaga sp.]MBN9372128.1 sigma-70 family RNA polymerase sigma factor [Hydrogenophaga sp.]